MMTDGSPDDRLSPAWIALGCAFAITIGYDLSDTIRFLIEPGYFLPILAAYIASRTGSRIINFLLVLGLVAAIHIHIGMDALGVSLNIPSDAYLISVLAACAFAKQWDSGSLARWFQPWWRWSLWAILCALGAGGFFRLGWHYEITDSFKSIWGVPAVVAALAVLASLNWPKFVMQLRSSHATMFQRKIRTAAVAVSLCILLAALLIQVQLPSIGVISVRYGLASSLNLLTVACFAATAFGLLDWRALVAMLVIVFGAAWVGTHFWIPMPVRFLSSYGKEAGEIVAGWVHAGEPEIYMLSSAVSAALFGRAIQPFWLRKEIVTLQQPQTLWLLTAVLSIEFIILPVASKGMFASFHTLLLGGLAFMAGLIWRRRALVAAPLSILLCYMIGFVVYTQRGLSLSFTEMGDFGIIAFPFVFFGVLLGEHLRKIPNTEGALRTVDLTPLAKLVRDLDVSATLKAFVAVLAPFIVLANLKAIHTFTRQFVVMDFGFIESEAFLFGSGILILIILGAFAPLCFILTDWIARREAGRYLSAISGAGLGLLGIVAIAQALGASTYLIEEMEWAPFEAGRWFLSGTISVVLAVVVGRMMAKSKRIRAVLLGALLLPGITLIVLVAYQNIGAFQGTKDYREMAAVLAVFILIALSAWFIIRGVRLRLLLSGARPRSLLLGDLRGGFWVRMAFLVGLPSSMWRLSAMRKPSFWLFIVSRPLVYVGAVLLVTKGQNVGILTGLVLGLLLIITGHFAFVVAKRLAARDVWRLEQTDEACSPILFLRSFDDDQFDFKRPVWNIRARWFDLWSFRSNADQALIDEVAQYGPVVALGRPGETKIPFGALRHYATDEEWQAVITDTARRSQAIVIAAGDSGGVLWEYDLLKREGLIDRTLLLFRPGADGTEANRLALEAFCKAQNINGDFEGDRNMVALLQTDSGPTMLTARRNIAGAYVAAIRAHFQHCSVRALGDPADLFAVMA
jgi:hypothetical protein